ncbi:uncharacterized protein EDB93DRAFT_1106518 [Suillus bovinus]|uniref:uncharacterized protein n=1 Tax=Suillus bovinus TaxID=48563 RepID=UPI001B85F37F|nr:uncharacterized protein EDB93DRAFT_1106518 [Suillus bovinus]KAG2137902.1 hypothetical protein EDB93DRAFT_1106518 [Suillus bovinus]
MKIGLCTPAAKIPQGRSKGQKRSMPNSPPESPTLQPVPAPPTWEDCPDNTYEQDQGSFEPLQLPKTMASECRNHICITSWIEKLLQKIGDASSAIRMGSTNIKIVLGSHSIAQDVAGVNIVAILSTGSVNGMVSSSSKVVSLMWDLFEGDGPEDQLEPEDLPSVSGPEFQPKENTMVIIDKSGVHRLEVRCCDCPNTMSLDIQMFRHGFFPASFNKPKTVFTFRVLDNFLLDNLECSTSAMNYYSKLRNYISPSSKGHYIDKALGKDRYRELMRVARQWRQLKTMKWHGFGHRSNAPNARDLALFCPTCPQPGINISLSGNETLDDWKYTRSFVMDGNFKAKHLHPIKPFDEVWLADGLGFMVGKDSCNNHQAVNQANATQHKLESTGIGGVACARHGCFVPHAMVDFQKGKRQAEHEVLHSQVDHASFADK